MSNGTKVVKRDGHSEVLNLEKVHKMTEEACEGLAGVSASQVEIQSGLQCFMDYIRMLLVIHGRKVFQIFTNIYFLVQIKEYMIQYYLTNIPKKNGIK